ncbi:hypothetical protein PS15p_203758 [Mucor circinelloides]
MLVFLFIHFILSHTTYITMGFLGHFKINKSTKKTPAVDDDNMSTASTIAPSKSRSAIEAFLATFSTEKYMNDPTRTTSHPDVVGYYYDPMSCGGQRNVISAGYDCTNTGA